MGVALIEHALTCKPGAAAIMVGLWLEGRNRDVKTKVVKSIDLDATGPVYRGHKLSRIVNEFDNGYALGDYPFSPGYDHPTWVAPPTSTKGWARLDVRVIGNPWGLSVSDIPSDDEQEWLDASSHPCYWSSTD